MIVAHPSRMPCYSRWLDLAWLSDSWFSQDLGSCKGLMQCHPCPSHVALARLDFPKHDQLQHALDPCGPSPPANPALLAANFDHPTHKRLQDSRSQWLTSKPSQPHTNTRSRRLLHITKGNRKSLNLPVFLGIRTPRMCLMLRSSIVHLRVIMVGSIAVAIPQVEVDLVIVVFFILLLHVRIAAIVFLLVLLWLILVARFVRSCVVVIGSRLRRCSSWLILNSLRLHGGRLIIIVASQIVRIYRFKRSGQRSTHRSAKRSSSKFSGSVIASVFTKVLLPSYWQMENNAVRRKRRYQS